MAAAISHQPSATKKAGLERTLRPGLYLVID